VKTTNGQPESVIEVDQHNLDEEWCVQPGKHQRFCEALAEAQLDADQAKAKLELTEAKIKVQARQDPRKFGFEKATDDVVDTVVKGSKSYHTALEALNQARYKVNVLRARVEASEHKKRALENLVELHGRAYFAAPKDRSAEAHAGRAERSAKGMGKIGKTGRYA
jgi:hypothetical protein